MALGTLQGRYRNPPSLVEKMALDPRSREEESTERKEAKNTMPHSYLLCCPGARQELGRRQQERVQNAGPVVQIARRFDSKGYRTHLTGPRRPPTPMPIRSVRARARVRMTS